MHHYKFAISMFSRLSSRIYSSKCLLNQHQIKLGEKRAKIKARFALVWFFAGGTKATIRACLRYKFCTLINLTLPLPYTVSTQAGVVFPCMTTPSLACGE